MNTRIKKKATPKNNYAIVVSEFNKFITQRLLDGCIDELNKLGVKEKQTKIFWVPGAFEIPLVALKLAKKKNIDAVICLGAVVKGETYHFELVAQNAAKGIAQASLMTGKPIIFEVLATETIQQAEARAEENGDNKGRDAAKAAFDMVSLMEKI